MNCPQIRPSPSTFESLQIPPFWRTFPLLEENGAKRSLLLAGDFVVGQACGVTFTWGRIPVCPHHFRVVIGRSPNTPRHFASSTLIGQLIGRMQILAAI